MKLSGYLLGLAMIFAPVAGAQTSPADRTQVLEALAKSLEADYVFPETGKKYALMLRAKAAGQDYAAGDDFEFAQKVNDDLAKVNPDKHLRLLAPLPPPGGGGPRIIRGPGPGPGMKAVEATDRLTPDIAYIRFGVFPGDPETMADLEKFLVANAGAAILIVDARGHRGGGVDEIDAMFADLFTKQVDLVQMETTQAVIDQQPDMLIQGASLRKVASKPGMVTLQHFTTPSSHPRLANTKLYALQSGFSGSAAEHFLFEVKMSGRGKLVGETSAGAGHFGFPLDLPSGFSTFMPAGRTFDPSTDKDWEGVGVAPDIAVSADLALIAALKDAGIGEVEAQRLNAKVGFVMPKRGPGGGPVIIRSDHPPG